MTLKFPIAILLLILCTLPMPGLQAEKKMNIIWITVDDMNQDSVGIFGAVNPGVTPNMDMLAKSGVYFPNAYSAAPTCLPSRHAMMTGKHPHESGTFGFNDYIYQDTATLPSILKANGYCTFLLGKFPHYQLGEWRDLWSVPPPINLPRAGRQSAFWAEQMSKTLSIATDKSSPFFLSINLIDPHRPFIASKLQTLENKNLEKKYSNLFPEIFYDESEPLRYSPESIKLPAWLIDTPETRLEYAQYLSCVNRADDAIGKIVHTLNESGDISNTIIIFCADQGASFPGVKQNCYAFANRTPLIVCSPNIVPKKCESLVSLVDVMPTILEGLDLDIPPSVTGKSFWPILTGKGNYQEQDYVFISNNYIVPGLQVYPSRAVISKTHTMIFNSWCSDEKIRYNKTEPLTGLAWDSMVQLAETQTKVRDIVAKIQRREIFEFYPIEIIPFLSENYYNRPDQQIRISEFYYQLHKFMTNTRDPLLACLTHNEPIPAKWLTPFNRGYIIE